MKEEGGKEVAGDPAIHIFPSAVEAHPDAPMVALRQRFVAAKEEGELRVVSYNLLANQYTSQEDAQERIFAHVGKKWLDAARRAQMLLHEMLSMRADLLLLQEVDEKTFYTLLQPAFEASGYDAVFAAKSAKSKSMQEGCAVVYSLAAFEEAQVEDKRAVPLRLLLQQEDPALDGLFKQHPGLAQMATEKVATTAQFLRLTLKQREGGDSRSIVVANTHLFYHPYADHIRAIQAYAVIREIDRIRGNDAVVLGGDLNSDPQSGVISLLMNGGLDESFPHCWKYLRTFAWEHEESLLDVSVQCQTPSLRLPERFPPLQIATGLPSFTHYNCGYKAVLDYVFASKPAGQSWGFEVVRTAPVPELESIIEQHTSIPNRDYPSDHILVATDLRLVDTE